MFKKIMFTKNKYVKLHKSHLRRDDPFSDDGKGTVMKNQEAENEIPKVTNLADAMERVVEVRGRQPQSPSDRGSRVSRDRLQPLDDESNRKIG